MRPTRSRPVGSLGARGAKSLPYVKRRSEAAARQENKDSRLAPLTRPGGPLGLSQDERSCLRIRRLPIA